jgi:hypothetical protein
MRRHRVRARVARALTTPTARPSARPVFAVAALTLLMGVTALAWRSLDRWRHSQPPAKATAPLSSAGTAELPLPAMDDTERAAEAPSKQPVPRVPPRRHEPTAKPGLLEGQLVHAAAHSLRQEHDPRHALRLLSRYFATYPEGVLAEEALVLAIEAAKEAKDPRAAALGKLYLQRFPNGRFHDLAKRAQQSD